jgi:hypothetical protein
MRWEAPASLGMHGGLLLAGALVARAVEEALAERRQLLFELWDECDNTNSGREARASILAFIRRRLPLGGADAYSPDELERLNGRRTTAEPFDPYGVVPSR